jgi:hypothetical protein
MRGLLFLSLVGAALYAFLVLTYKDMPDRKAENAFAGETQPNQQVALNLSSWGTYLPSQNSHQTAPLVSERKTGAWYQLAAQEAKAQASASNGGGAPVEWARIILAAKVHSEGSISSPPVRSYPPGTDLQVIRREGSWVYVSDPVTQGRGWVLEKYLASRDGPNSTQAALESTSDAVPATAGSPTSKNWSRSSKRTKSAVRSPNTRSAKPAFRASKKVTRWDPRNVRWARRADRRRGFDPFMLGR